MFPYSPEAAEDEPTMTDLRGVLPAQRPPVDATVLDEPTSEVPMIRPLADRSRNGEVERPATTEPATVPDLEQADTADIEPADIEVLELPAADEPVAMTDLETVDLADVETADLADPDTVDVADPEAELTAPGDAALPSVETDLIETDLTETDLTGADTGILDPPDPEVADMVEPTPPHQISEMAKMTWSPVAPRLDPPESTPATPLAEAEPEPSAPFAMPSTDLATPQADLATPTTDLAAPPAYPAYSADPPAYPADPPAYPADPPAYPAAPTRPDLSAGPPVAGRPGDVAESTIALWSQESADHLRDQWRDLQVQFFDDPEAAVAGAKGLVTEAVHELADTLLEAQDSLDPYRDDGRVDTEMMRVAMRRYREFLERVLAL